MNSLSEKKYLRMSLNERIQHIFLFTTFFTLVITGFGLLYPESFWVKWIVAVVGKNAFEARGVVHRIAAVIMVIASVYHIFYIIFTKRGRKFIFDMWFKIQDFKDMFSYLKYITGISKDKPKFGRFSYIEKMEYWAVVWGTVVMGATGGVLWFENEFLRLIGMDGMYIATAIHLYEAILASLAILVWHFYFIFINPDVFPMNKAWLTGYLTHEQMKHEHPLELEQIESNNIKI